MTKTTKNSIMEISPASKTNEELAVDLFNALDVFEKGLESISAGAEALSALGQIVEQSGHEPGSAIAWAADNHECEIMAKQEQFAELRAMILELVPAAKAEGDRQAAFMKNHGGDLPAQAAA